MAPAPSLGSGLSIVSAIAEQLTQPGEKLFWLISQPSKVFFGMTSPRQKGEQKANRERLRLEINVTQTKQTTQPHSNREAEALFSNRVRADHSSRRNIDRPVRRSNLKISNREPLRRVRADDSARRNDDVIDVTQTKQTTQPHPNREAEALFSNRDLNLENSNRESRRSN
jgi:hypothetical protein